MAGARKNMLPERLRKVAAAAALCIPFVAPASGAGTIEYVSGAAAVRPAEGAPRTAARGGSIAPGETVETGNGRLHLRMADGAYIALQPGTTLRFDEYRIKARAGDREGVLISLLRGGMRTITGLIGRFDRSSYELRTPDATIGIRGTEFSVTHLDGTAVHVGGGEISLCSSAGCIPVAAGQAGRVAGPDTPPLPVRRTAPTGPGSTPPLGPTGFRAGEQRDSAGRSTVLPPPPPPPPPRPDGEGRPAGMH